MSTFVNRKRGILSLFLTAAFVIAGPQGLHSKHPLISQGAPALAILSQSPALDQPKRPIYETRTIHDPNGTGKFYMGREIAQVMGPGGIEWLDRRERELEEHPAQVLDALALHPGEVVADLGAGSGNFTFRMAPKVGQSGKVLAVEIQEEMLHTLRDRKSTRL